jgi:hypothetical protein
MASQEDRESYPGRRPSLEETIGISIQNFELKDDGFSEIGRTFAQGRYADVYQGEWRQGERPPLQVRGATSMI